MAKNRMYTMKFKETYPLYVAKAKRKGRTEVEVDEIICWLTGYNEQDLGRAKVEEGTDMGSFFSKAPSPHPNRHMITGSICGVKISEIEDPFVKEIRYLDKLIDELAKGKSMDKILRK